MQKHTSEKYQETYYETTLDNGLRVVLFHRPGFDKSFFLMGTPFGAFDLQQVDEEGNQYHFPAGIAHFLEHKMFEHPDGDVMDQFSNMGVNVNAFTSYGETCYYFSTTQAIKEPLELLLDFTQALHIDEASVEKEKGIICQELAMYRQQSDSRLINETFGCMYHEHPLKYDIGGDDASVNGTTLAQLQDCFALNYAPSKTILVGVSSEEPATILEWIKANQAKKAFAQTKRTHRPVVKEPLAIKKSEHAFQMDVSSTKASVAFKFEGNPDGLKRSTEEWAIRLALDSVFSSLNPQYQMWMDQELINDYFSYEVEIGEDFGLILFTSETKDLAGYEQMILAGMEQLRTHEVAATTLDQLKKRYYGQNISAMNSFENTAIYFMRNAFAHVDFFEALNLIDGIDGASVLACMQVIDPANHTIVRVEPLHD